MVVRLWETVVCRAVRPAVAGLWVSCTGVCRGFSGTVGICSSRGGDVSWVVSLYVVGIVGRAAGALGLP